MYNPQITVDRITELRTIKGISLSKLNEACGLNKNTITVSANSKTGLSAKILSDVAKFLGCSVDYLLGETDNPNISMKNSMTIENSSNKIDTANGDIQSSDNAIVEIETIISKLKGASRYRAIADVLEVLEKYA